MTNVELVRTLHEIWNTGKLDLSESVYASDFAGYWPASSEVPVRRGVEGVSTPTHSGPYWGLEPTGKRIEIQEISILRCAGGRVVEQWCIFDELARLQQLGVREAYLRRMLKL